MAPFPPRQSASRLPPAQPDRQAPSPLCQSELASARLLLARGDRAGAERLLSRALRATPAAYVVARALAGLLQKRGRHGQAFDALERAARTSGRVGDLLDAAAQCLRGEDVTRAASLLDTAIVAEPTGTEARLQLGQLLLQHGDAGRAAAVLTPVLEHEPDNLPALQMLTSIQLGASARITDLSLFHRLVEIAPDRRRALATLALAERYAGDLQSALAHSAEALDPADPVSCATHADLLELAGRTGEALALLEPWMTDSSTLSAAMGLTLSRLLGREGRHEQALAVLDRALRAPGLNAATAHSLCLRRGSVLDRLDRPEAAWKAWSRAKLLQKNLYDARADRQRVTALREHFARARCAGLEPAPPASPRPLLVLGMYRSGTTLLEQILCMHPQVGGADEVLVLGAIAARLQARPGWQRQWTAGHAARLAQPYLAALRHGCGGASVVVDKNPRNWEHIGLAALLCPNAVVVHMDRHPLDVCVSSMATGFSHRNAFAADPKSFAAGYALQAETMTLWKADPPLPILSLRYEDLVREPEAQVRKVLDFAGLPWDPACLDFWQSERRAFTPSQDQVREPLNTRSINRWRRFEKVLRPAREALEAQGIDCAAR